MSDWTCECGARNARGRKFCEACGSSRLAEAEKPKKQCLACGETVRVWSDLRQADDGTRRCSTCHLAWLKVHASRPADRCSESGCSVTVVEHIATAKRLTAQLAARMRPTSLSQDESGLTSDPLVWAEKQQRALEALERWTRHQP